jgi:hypothetical protein
MRGGERERWGKNSEKKSKSESRQGTYEWIGKFVAPIANLFSSLKCLAVQKHTHTHVAVYIWKGECASKREIERVRNGS